MARKRKYRGISIGTIAAVLLTAAVVWGMMRILPKLTSPTDLSIDTDRVLQALSWGDDMPELTLSDIPIQAQKPAATLAVEVLHPTQTPALTLAPPPVTPEPTAAPNLGGRFSLTLGGSVSMSSDLRKAGYFSEAEKYDFSDWLSLLAPEMQSDLTMVSFENLIDPEAKLSDTVTAADTLTMLSAAGVDAVALGFKQSYDQGMSGVISTVNAVRAKGMLPVGVYESADDADLSQRIVELGGVKVALLHYTDGLSAKGAKAFKKDGSAFAVAQDAVASGADDVLSDVAKVRDLGAEVIVISLNWGSVGKAAVTKQQTAFAQQLADAGVDVIIGTGSRVVQETAWLNGKAPDGSPKRTLCAYSLGGLVNESRKNGNVAAMLLKLQIAYDGHGGVAFEQAAYTPTYIWRFKQDGRWYYRVVASDQPAPDGMESDQITSMNRALQTVQKALGKDPAVTLRTK